MSDLQQDQTFVEELLVSSGRREGVGLDSKHAIDFNHRRGRIDILFNQSLVIVVSFAVACFFSVAGWCGALYVATLSLSLFLSHSLSLLLILLSELLTKDLCKCSSGFQISSLHFSSNVQTSFFCHLLHDSKNWTRIYCLILHIKSSPYPTDSPQQGLVILISFYHSACIYVLYFSFWISVSIVVCSNGRYVSRPMW